VSRVATPLLPGLWSHFLLNLLLQIVDGVLTYIALSLGMEEANPLVRTAILEWGEVWGLLYWKTLACVLLLLIFALRHRRRSLAIKAFTLTAAVYGYVWVAGLCAFLLHLA
jgi:hypothetical protein